MNFDTHFNKGSVLEKDESEESNLDVSHLKVNFQLQITAAREFKCRHLNKILLWLGCYGKSGLTH